MTTVGELIQALQRYDRDKQAVLIIDRCDDQSVCTRDIRVELDITEDQIVLIGDDDHR